MAAGSQQPSGSLVPGMDGVDMGDMLGALEAVELEPVKLEAAKAPRKALTLPLPLILTLTPTPALTLTLTLLLPLTQAGDAKAQYLEWMDDLMQQGDEEQKVWHNRLHYGDQVSSKQ